MKYASKEVRFGIFAIACDEPKHERLTIMNASEGSRSRCVIWSEAERLGKRDFSKPLKN